MKGWQYSARRFGVARGQALLEKWAVMKARFSPWERGPTSRLSFGTSAPEIRRVCGATKRAVSLYSSTIPLASFGAREKTRSEVDGG